MTTLLITATAFEDVTNLAYSLHLRESDTFTPIQTCVSSAEAWAYLTQWLPEAYPVEAIRISVIDRRPGTRATSRSAGQSLT